MDRGVLPPHPGHSISLTPPHNVFCGHIILLGNPARETRLNEPATDTVPSRRRRKRSNLQSAITIPDQTYATLLSPRLGRCAFLV